MLSFLKLLIAETVGIIVMISHQLVNYRLLAVFLDKNDGGFRNNR